MSVSYSSTHVNTSAATAYDGKLVLSYLFLSCGQNKTLQGAIAGFLKKKQKKTFHRPDN